MTAPGPRAEPTPDYEAALLHLAHRDLAAGILAVSGPDRVAFLQGQLTQEVRGLESGQARRTAGLTSKGKVLYFGWLAAAPERLLLVLPASRCEAVLAHLSRYAVFQKVSLADATAQFRLTALYGPSALAVTLSDAVTRLAADGEMAGSALSAMPGHGEVLRALVEAGSVALGDASAEILRVEAGRPLFGTDADETNLPDEIGLESAISRTKGCFVGQEIVARLRTYGSVSRRLVGFRFPGGALAPGTVFADPDKPGHALGRITSAAMSPRFGPIGLGFAARDVPDGATLAGDGGATAIVGPLPFA